jgi:hypothetical protein
MEVFCSECRHYRPPYQSFEHSYPAICLVNKKIKETPLDAYVEYARAEEKNFNNRCSSFERRQTFWTRFKGGLIRILEKMKAEKAKEVPNERD